MTNTSGIPNFQSFPDNDQYERLPTTVEKTVERFKYAELMFSPGSQFGYSSSGFVLLGYIIEQVSGQSYEDVINQHIFEPLKMNDSGYDHPSTMLLKRASGYASESVAAILFNEKYESPKKYIKDTLYQIVLQKDVVSARNAYNELLDKYPDDYDFSKEQLNWLGVELRNDGMFDEAIEIYEWIIEIDPDWFEGYNGIADVYKQKGDKELAIKNYAKSLEMNPERWYAISIAEELKELTEKDE
jgi:tetratricopeptide (TPR) repeat protein